MRSGLVSVVLVLLFVAVPFGQMFSEDLEPLETPDFDLPNEEHVMPPSIDVQGIIHTDGYEWTDHMGLKYSNFTKILAQFSGTILLSFTKGVFPIQSNVFFDFCRTSSFSKYI